MINRSFKRVPLPAVIAGLATAFVVGCSDSSKLPAGPSASATSSGTRATADGSAAPSVLGGRGGTQRIIHLMDACDPETFNAAVGPGTCVRNGGVMFANFLELLTQNHFVGPWHFTPPQAQMDVGDVLMAVNHGGETHTFTEVEEFGGGIVPDLNQRMGLTNVAPECNTLAPADFIPAGGSSSETEEEEGVEKYQCCIHPWMRAEVHVGKH
jgi:plastocyanin